MDMIIDFPGMLRARAKGSANVNQSGSGAKAVSNVESGTNLFVG